MRESPEGSRQHLQEGEQPQRVGLGDGGRGGGGRGGGAEQRRGARVGRDGRQPRLRRRT